MAKTPKANGNGNKTKRVTRYTYEDVKEPRTPETGHTALLPADEQVVTVPLDRGWSKALKAAKLLETDERPVVVDLDPAADPTLLWAGKRSRRQVPILPLQRNEIVSESRIAQIINRTRKAAEENTPQMGFASMFADLEKQLREKDKSHRVEFYTHEEGWKNKLICGDSLQVMESLIHYEGLKGKVQMIYMDPPYGISYDSNFQQQVDSTENDPKEAADDVLTIKAFRDTWALGVHSYLSYLQERLYLCRELLSDSGSIFFQISDTNIHHARELLDEVFGATAFVSQIAFTKTTGQSSNTLSSVFDYLLWYCKDRSRLKFRQLYRPKVPGEEGATEYNKLELSDGTIRQATQQELDGTEELPPGAKLFSTYSLFSGGEGKDQLWEFEWSYKGKKILTKCPRGYHFKTGNDPKRLQKLVSLNRLVPSTGQRILKRYLDDFRYTEFSNLWTDTRGEPGMLYAVQTAAKVIQRCLLMTTDPGDIAFDPTCGSGATAYSAEKLGRRWVTCDTSRVAVNVARKRLLSATFDHFKTRGTSVASGFIYQTAKQVTVKSLVDDLEPETILLYDQPEPEPKTTRVTGPFELMTVGRYSVEDWKGYVVTSGAEGSDKPKLENYIEVICHLYRQEAAVQGTSGLVHAIAETEKQRIAISVGPLSGRVTAKQINDAVQDALSSGILEVHVLGWAFESNVGEAKTTLEKRGKVKVELIMIRPDTLAEGLKITNAASLFSPLALPEIEVKAHKNGNEKQVTVTLKGVAIFDRKTRATDYKRADSGYISAWYLDEDYDGDCFVDSQMFFDFKKAPNLRAIGLDVEPQEFALAVTSQPFAVRGYKRIAVKVVDVYGNESTIVKEL